MIYDRNTLEQYLPGIWDRRRVLDAQPETAPEPGMPRASVDPSKAGTKVAMLADVQLAYRRAGLSDDEKRMMVLRFGFSEEYQDAARLAGLAERTAYRVVDRAIEKMLSFLNGKNKREEKGMAKKHKGYAECPICKKWYDRQTEHTCEETAA